MSLKVFALKENPGHGQALAAAIMGMGHHITVVASPKEAVQELARYDYDVILSGLHFETESAFAFLRIVKASESLRARPFAFCCIRPSKLTKTMSESIEAAARALGADALLLVEQYDDPRLRAILSDFEKRLGSDSGSQLGANGA